MVSKPWSQPTRFLVLIISLIVLVWLLIAFAPLVQALIVAALLAYLLDPIVELLTRRTHLSRLASARLVYALFLALLASIPALLSTMAVSQFHRVETEMVDAISALSRWLAQPLIIFDFRFQPLAVLNDLEQLAGNSLATMSGGALGALLTVTTNLIWGLTALVSLYYLLAEAPKIKPGLISLVPAEYQAEVGLLLDEIDNAWRLFLRAQLIIFIIFSALLLSSSFLVLWLYRSGLVPLSPIGLIVLLVIVYTLVQQVDNIWLRPYFFGTQLRLHPGVVFVGLIGALALSGVLGVIIIVPMIATAKIIGIYVHRKLLGLPPWPHLAPPEKIDSQPAEPVSVAEFQS